MRTIDRKLVRDLWDLKGQSAAIAAVIAAGVAMFVMFLSAFQSLTRTQASYYERNRFADGFASLKRAPLSLADRIAEIPGVSRVEPRVVQSVTLDLPTLAEPAVARLISLPVSGDPALNVPHLRSGRLPALDARGGEVVVSEAFAEAHGFELGDTVEAIINESRETLRVIGTALSPEYVAVVPPGGLFPDDRRFGVFWMSYPELAAGFDMEGAFNDISIDLAPGASEPEVLRRVDLLLDRYGGLGAIGRGDQMSHQFLSEELKQLGSIGMVGPMIFLGVAAFLLNVVLTRLISAQREQIGALKAFGYGRRAVAGHYLKFALVISLAGAAIGCGLGAWLGRGMTGMYAEFYRFPSFEIELNAGIVLLAFAVSGGAAAAGAFGAVRRAVSLPAAAAMRPEPPARYRRAFIERLGLARFFSQPARMVLRHLERRPLKSFISTLGLSMAVAVLIVGNFSKDAVDYLMDFQFRLADRQDITVTFAEVRSISALREIESLPGALRAEPFRSAPVQLRSGHRGRRIAIMGLVRGGDLKRLVNRDERGVPVPEQGVMLSSALAERLGVGPGDTVTAEVLEGARPVRELPVSGLITEYAGLSGYMSIEALNRFMKEGRNISGAYLSADAAAIDDLYRRLKELPGIAGVSVKSAALRSFRETMAENLLIMRFFMVAFASVIAVGVVYNSARIILAERSREFGTLRVIGFTRAEISAILLGELAILTVLALPMGMALGYALAASMTSGLQNDLYRIPLVIAPSTYALAGGVVAVAAAVSGFLVRRRLDRLDLISVLKSAE